MSNALKEKALKYSMFGIMNDWVSLDALHPMIRIWITNPWHMSACFESVASITVSASMLQQKPSAHLLLCNCTAGKSGSETHVLCLRRHNPSLQHRLPFQPCYIITPLHHSMSMCVCTPHFKLSDHEYIAVIHPGCFVTVSGSAAPCGCFFLMQNKVLPSAIFPSHLAVDEDTALWIHHKIFSLIMWPEAKHLDIGLIRILLLLMFISAGNCGGLYV